MASEKTKVCEFCGKSIAVNAVHCPQCGGRFKRGDKLWLWTLIVLVLGIIVYFMLPINHVIDLKLIHEQESITNIKELAATPAYYAAMPDASGWLDVDQMIRDRSTVYEG